MSVKAFLRLLELSFPLISAEKISQLGSIDAFISSPSARNDFSNQGKSPAIRIYAECRGQYLSNSLSNLSMASISTSKRKNPEEIYRQGTSGIGTYASGIEGIFFAEFGNISAVKTGEQHSNQPVASRWPNLGRPYGSSTCISRPT